MSKSAKIPRMTTALIAEDEPLLARALQMALQTAWPALQIVDVVGDGASAVRQALALQPDVLFLDIRMPGMSGLEASATLQQCWNTAARRLPAVVFVTAYDEYAIKAFEVQAQDYLLKPLQMPRLEKMVAKLQQTLAPQPLPESAPNATLTETQEILETLPLSVGSGAGSSIHMVPVQEVVYFEAADKYVRVLTPHHEYLMRTPLKDIVPRLNPRQFWQIHRGTVVNASHIARVVRNEAGKMHLTLRSRPESLPVSRVYAQQFRAM